MSSALLILEERASALPHGKEITFNPEQIGDPAKAGYESSMGMGPVGANHVRKTLGKGNAMHLKLSPAGARSTENT